MSHDHKAHHHHDHETGELSFNEKAIKLLTHWQQHNDDHAGNYRRWADEFRRHQLPEAAGLLESAAELTLQINQLFNQAAKVVSDHTAG